MKANEIAAPMQAAAPVFRGGAHGAPPVGKSAAGAQGDVPDEPSPPAKTA